MLSHSGTYSLVFRSSLERLIAVGKLGQLRAKPGFYVYVGSAFGPGGLAARVAHHGRSSGYPRWHIDYLGLSNNLEEVWYTYDPMHREHQWTEIIDSLKGSSIPLVGFGSSDCRCQSHLYFFPSKPPGRSFRRRVHVKYDNHGKIIIEKLLF